MTDAATVGSLAQALEGVSKKALEWADKVLSTPIDPECPSLMRAQSSATQTILNTQLRADALLLRKMHVDKALETLMKTIREKEALTPANAAQRGRERCNLLVGSLEQTSTL